MTHRSFWRSFACIAMLAYGSLASTTLFGGAISVSGGQIITVSSTLEAVSGTAANGSTWASFVTGTSPVAYFDLSTGSLMFDPKDKNVTLVDFRYGSTGSINIATPGPYVYATGTTPAISTGEIERTLPAGAWAATTAFPARLSGSVTFTNSPSLFTSGGNTASTNGWFNVPWSFGAIAPSLINSQATLYSTTAGEGFRATGAGVSNLLGYGNGIGMFSWVEGLVTGTKFGAVIPVQPVPEPSTLLLAGLGAVGVGIHLGRRLRRD